MPKRIDVLRAIASGELPQRPVHQLIGARFTSAEEGKVTLEFDTDERHHTNPLQTLLDRRPHPRYTYGRPSGHN